MNGATVNVEVEETQEGLKFNKAHIPTPTSTSTQQLYVSNQPSNLPYVLPLIIPCSVIVQSAPQNGILNTSQISMITNGKTSSLSEHKNPVRMNVPGNPYALPNTWLFPLYANGVPPQSLDFASKSYIPKQSSTSSFWKTVAHVKEDQRFPLKKVRGEASTTTEIMRPSVEVYRGKASGKTLAQKHKVTSEGNEETVIGSSVRKKDALKRRNAFITSVAATGSLSETDGRVRWSRIDAVTAAEARKRRKDVLKCKNFHYSRQSHVKI